jgi:periplasmic divalent cation tolerance protein
VFILQHPGGLGKFDVSSTASFKIGCMAEASTFARIVLTTASSAEEAERLARNLVEERLAACATLIPSVRSIYRWKDAIEDATETLLLLKTGNEQLAALEARLRELHSYETPEFLVLNVESGSRAYLEWLAANLVKA